MIQGRNSVYINNGSSVRPDWADRIIISYIPDLAVPIPHVPTYTASGVASSDIVNDTYTLIPVSIVKDYWLVYDNDGGISTNNQYITSFYSNNYGDYRCNISKAAGTTNVSSLFYIGRYGNMVAGLGSSNADFSQRGSSGMAVTLDDTIGTSYIHNGWVSYARNVMLVGASSSEAIALNEKMTVAFPTSTYPALINADNRVYIKELGCYFGNGDWQYYEDLKCDTAIIKSNIKTISKHVQKGGVVSGLTIPDKFFIYITLIDGDYITIQIPSVKNKSTWANTISGLDIAYEEIMSWI